jgi:hypothetical protein
MSFLKVENFQLQNYLSAENFLSGNGLLRDEKYVGGVNVWS